MMTTDSISAIKKYSELIQLPTFEERYNYLRLSGRVGESTFGFDRYMNQMFYRSREWNSLRHHIIVRDRGCDLAVPDQNIYGIIYIHHLNPITIEDVKNSSDRLFDPDNLVCVSLRTHNAIHFGDDTVVKEKAFIGRAKNDTCPWRN